MPLVQLDNGVYGACRQQVYKRVESFWILPEQYFNPKQFPTFQRIYFQKKKNIFQR